MRKLKTAKAKVKKNAKDRERREGKRAAKRKKMAAAKQNLLRRISKRNDNNTEPKEKTRVSRGKRRRGR